ncbi:hypothetical protein ACIPY6_37250 [Streptomyces sp. NPDC090054]|uniref:hypothetical protein n=1 Tax=Streptomyces sp. NPDC090054 TaxID=3365933 RepID=UPI00381F686B
MPARASWEELAEQVARFLPALVPDEAARIVAGLTPSARGRIRAHLAAHPDALVSGSSLAPLSVQALITTLTAMGVAGVRTPACLRCGRIRPLRRAVPGGRVCLGCEGILAAQADVGPCTACGETRPRPSHKTCGPCRRDQLSTGRACSDCGNRSLMDPCANCRPRPLASCAVCGDRAPVCARWPLGPVCKPCYRQARRNPAPCPGCDRRRVLIARAKGRRVCGPCAGHPDPHACPRCAEPRSYQVKGLCDRCAVHDQLIALFPTVPDDGAYAHLRATLADSPEPGTVLTWLRNSRSAPLLADLVATGRPVTHADLDLTAAEGRAAARTVEYLRGLLTAYQVLPERDELSARIERHLQRVAARHPEHALLLRSYVRWSLLPRARRHERLRGGGFLFRARGAYARINRAAEFLSAMTARGLPLQEVTQHEVDGWLAVSPGTRFAVRDFVIWATRRGHARILHVPHWPKKDPVALDEDSHWELLHQCLTDTDLPLEVRGAGAILLLFGQHLTRITALTTQAVTTVGEDTFLTLDRTPIPLPVPLGALLADLANRPPPTNWAANTARGWLFPGGRPGQHLSATVLGRRLAAHQIPSRPARATALVTLAQDLPPAVLGPMLGLHPVTAAHWRRRAATDWTAYLEARLAAPPS